MRNQYRRICSSLAAVLLSLSLGGCALSLPEFGKKEQAEAASEQKPKEEVLQTEKEEDTQKNTENETENSLPEDTVSREEVRYFLSTLPDAEQDIYRQLRDGLLSHEEEISLTVNDMERVGQIISLVIDDYPEIFWFEGNAKMMGYSNEVIVSPQYAVDLAEMERRKEEVEDALVQAEDAIGLQLSASSSEDEVYQYAKAAFAYVDQQVEYQTGAADNQNLYSSMVKGESVCAGYARMYQYLLQQAGVECVYVTGKSLEGESHAWDMVRIGENYYHVDPTYGDWDYLAEDSDLPEEMLCDYNYLCLTDAEVAADRVQDPGNVYPVCEDAEYNFFVRSGRRFASCGEEVKKDILQNLADGNHCWYGQFETDADYEKFMEQVEDGMYGELVLAGDPTIDGSVTAWNLQVDEFRCVFLWY